MDGNGHQNSNAGSSTTEQRELQTNHTSTNLAVHGFILTTNIIIGSLIPLKFGAVSPFGTSDGDHLMKAFIAEMTLYWFSLIALGFSARYGDLYVEDLTHHISLLLGALPMILAQFILIGRFAWIISSIWCLGLLVFLYKYLPPGLCNKGLQAFRRIREMLKHWNYRSDESGNVSIIDKEGDIETQPRILKSSIMKLPTAEHQSPNHAA